MSDVVIHKSGYKFDVNKGCASKAFKSGKIVCEKECSDTVLNVIAVPILDDSKNIIGVFEVVNSEESQLDKAETNSLLVKYANYINLLFYSNNLLKVLPHLS